MHCEGRFHGKLNIDVDSLVCVRNREAQLSLSLRTCHVGRVLKTYCLDDTWFASILLFLRPKLFPRKIKPHSYKLNELKEVVADSRGCVSTFKLTDIICRCEIVHCVTSCCVDSTPSFNELNEPVFVLRFRLEETKFPDTFCLCPVFTPHVKMIRRKGEVLSPKPLQFNTNCEETEENMFISPKMTRKSSQDSELSEAKENHPSTKQPELCSPQHPLGSEKKRRFSLAMTPRSAVRRSLDLGSPEKSGCVVSGSEAEESIKGRTRRGRKSNMIPDEDWNHEEGQKNVDDDSDSSCRASWVSELFEEDKIVANNGAQCVTPIRLSLKRVWRDESPSKANINQRQSIDSASESSSVRRSSRKVRTPKRLSDDVSHNSASKRSSRKAKTPDITTRRRSTRITKASFFMGDEDDSDTESSVSTRHRSGAKTPDKSCLESKVSSRHKSAQKNKASRHLADNSDVEENSKKPRVCYGDDVSSSSDCPSVTPKSARRKFASPPESTTSLSQRTPRKTPCTSDKTPCKSPKTPNAKTPSRISAKPALTPSMPSRASAPVALKTSLEQVRKNLHVSAVPMSLPCREMEYRNVYNFVENKIKDASGGCMYISGVPGTGKTATVHAVIRSLKEEVNKKNLRDFQFIEANGLRMTEPRQVFVQVLKSLTGQKSTPQQAQDILAQRFCSGSAKNKTVVLLVDEVDMLRNRRQDVIYNLFDWPSKPNSRFIVLTIANTMDLPERLLKGRVTSRLGLTRLTFQPYSYKQLQEIVLSRLQGSDSFNDDAVELVARKVAACSGDVRRALDICRRASELVEEGCPVTMPIVNKVLSHMMNSANVCSIKNCSRLEKLFLQAVVAENERTGVEETTFISVYRQYQSLCALSSVALINISEAMALLNRLGTSGLLLTEHSRMDINQSIFLNVSADDIHYALNQPMPSS